MLFTLEAAMDNLKWLPRRKLAMQAVWSHRGCTVCEVLNIFTYVHYIVCTYVLQLTCFCTLM